MENNLTMISDKLSNYEVSLERQGEPEIPAAISIVGAGNWLVNHDSVGPRVLELARGRYGDTVELCETGSAGLALLDHLHGQDLMIIVDACTLGGKPGTIKVVDPAEYSASPSHNVSIHQINPFETLAVAKQIYPDQVPDRILLVLVETGNINELELERACSEVMELLDREIEARPDALEADAR